MAEVVSNAAREIFLLVQRVCGVFLAFICDQFLGRNFTPNLNTFAGYFVENTVREGQNATLSDIDVLLAVFQKAGVTIMLVLIVCTAVLQVFGHIIEIKDTMFGVFRRAFFTSLLIYAVGTFGGMAANVGEEIDASLTTELARALGSEYENSESYASFITDGIQNKAATINEDEGTTVKIVIDKYNAEAEAYAGLGQIVLELLSSIIQIALFLIVSYNLIKLCVELVRRYVTYGFLYMLMPMMSGFTVTTEGSQVFVTYLKMFSTQLAMVIGTKAWIGMCLFLMGNVETTITGCFVLISALSIGVQMEKYLRDMGLTVTGQGMALLDSVAMTGMIMGRAITGIASGVGAGAITLGSGMGKVGAVKFGAVMTGKPVDPESIAKLMNSNIAHGARIGKEMTASEMALAKQLTGRGFTNNRDLSNFLSDFKNPQQAMQDILNATCGNLSKALGAKDGMFITSDGSYQGGPRGGFGAQLMMKSKDGNGDVALRNGIISDARFSEQATAFTDNTGKTKYFNPTDEALCDFGGEPVPLAVAGEKRTMNPLSGKYDPMSGESKLATSVDFDQLVKATGDSNPSHYFMQQDEGYTRILHDADCVTTKDGATQMSGNANVCGYVTADNRTIGEAKDYSAMEGFYNAYSSSSSSETVKKEAFDNFAREFTTPTGKFYGSGITPTTIERPVSGGAYIITGTTSTGATVKIDLQPAMNNIKNSTHKNTAHGWMITPHRSSKKKIENKKS